ncbi:MAG: DegV family protein [Ruminococcaceae bacterium]|nr:DegV family protein [Oscillospiraceae bacterium]MBE6974918.1 DegV family protein [Oscillospiraceae bacterium]
MRIKITSDSTCDLSPAIVDQYNISIVPLTVIKDGREFKDNVTITPAEIFAHVAGGGALCSTTAVSIGEYQEFFAPLAAEYDGVLHINISAEFSSTHQNACLAASEFDNVVAVDSRNLSTGQGLVVLKACRLAETAESLELLKADLEAFTDKVEASFVVDKLEYLVKGGRCSSAAALGANLLNLKPCIDVKDGKMGVSKKYRGKYDKCLVSYVKERLEGREDLDTSMPIFITQTKVSDECYAGVREAVMAQGLFDTVYETVAGCTVSCHCGPGTLGILFVRK